MARRSAAKVVRKEFHLPPALSLLVSFSPTTALVLRTTPSSTRPNARDLHKPVLNPKTRPSFPAGTSEIVAWYLTAEGHTKASYGWSGQGHAFFDRIDPRAREDGRRWRGMDASPAVDSRILHLPIPDGAAFLLFSRSEVEPPDDGGGLAGQDTVLVRRPLGLYLLPQAPGSTPPGVPALPVPGELPGPGPWPIPLRLDPLPAIRTLTPVDGHIQGHQTLINKGAPDSCFDIVIMGDGFQEDELPLFDQRVERIVKSVVGMKEMELFKGVIARINLHVVRVVSLDSGITHCPDGTGVKRTYFGVEGHWLNADYAGYLGTHHQDRIFDAAELIAPIDQIDLILMLANCDGDGGSGFPGLKTVFLTRGIDEIEVALHESAHAFANLADEYITGCTRDFLAHFQNQVTEAQRVAREVWWRILAAPDELSGGDFKAVDTYTQPVQEAYRDMLGVFWGCQNIDGPPGQACDPNADPWHDPQGRNYYRPMRCCKMRRPFQPFCRVCRTMMAVIINRIADKSAGLSTKTFLRVRKGRIPSPQLIQMGGASRRPARPRPGLHR